jgi:hypothetical protein
VVASAWRIAYSAAKAAAKTAYRRQLAAAAAAAKRKWRRGVAYGENESHHQWHRRKYQRHQWRNGCGGMKVMLSGEMAKGVSEEKKIMASKISALISNGGENNGINVSHAACNLS